MTMMRQPSERRPSASRIRSSIREMSIQFAKMMRHGKAIHYETPIHYETMTG